MRHGNIRSAYSSDEEHYFSDDSVINIVKNQYKVGVADRENDNYAYVDAMVNRHNETDLRLLRASINDRPKDHRRSGDNEGG